MARRAWTGTLIGAQGAVACACWTIYDLIRGYRVSDPDTFSDYNVCQSGEIYISLSSLSLGSEPRATPEKE